jgi:REP element-mobilizing transposase RayT
MAECARGVRFFSLTQAFACAWRQKAHYSPLTWGIAPGIWNLKAPTLKARFTSHTSSIIICTVPQSLSKVILHIIFSTKDRQPWLDPEVRPRMHAFLATICRNLGADLVHVGGVADHVHILTTLPRTVSQAQLVEQIKKLSSNGLNARCSLSQVLLAARLCRVFGECQPARGRT